MESRDHFKNGASLKSLMSRGNFVIAVAVFLVLQSFMAEVCYAQYPTDKDLYPAVYGAIESRVNGKIKGFNYSDIDFYNNIYTVNVRVTELGSKTRFDLIIKLEQDGSVDISYENVESYESKTKKWKESVFTFFGWKKFASELSDKIYAIANNPKEYEKFEKASMADITYVYAIMSTFSALQFKEFIEKYAKNSVFNLNANVAEVSETDMEINGTTYKYLVNMTQTVSDADSPESAVVYCEFYTNRADVRNLRPGRVLKVTAILADARRGSMGKSITLILASND